MSERSDTNLLVFRLGERVRLRGRAYVVCGVSPFAASRRRVLLEDEETCEQVEAMADEVRRGDADRHNLLG